jgi:hypothetical protein
MQGFRLPRQVGASVLAGADDICVRLGLGVRQRASLRADADLVQLFLAEGAATCGSESRNHERDRLTHLSPYLQLDAVGTWRRREGGAGTDAARQTQHHHGGLYARPYGKKREAQSKVVDMLFGRQRPESGGVMSLSMPPQYVVVILCPFCVRFALSPEGERVHVIENMVGTRRLELLTSTVSR